MSVQNSNQPPLEKPRINPNLDDVGVRGVEALRAASSGWKQIRKGAAPSRQERILTERVQPKTSTPGQENNYKPGAEDSNEPVSMKALMESHKKMNVTAAVKKFFKGTPELLTLKMVQLFETHGTKLKIHNVEEAGFNQYKLTFSVD